MMQQLDHILHCLFGKTTMKIGEIPKVSAEELYTIWRWNENPGNTVKSSVHELFANRVKHAPHAQAVCGWDRNLTYHQLDTLSTKLALRLYELGVGPGVSVPLCFEKSAYVPVVMMAVMKAGGVSIALDITQPAERLESVVRQLAAKILVTSATHAELAAQLGVAAKLVVGQTFLDELPESSVQLPPVDPSSPLYIVFTSGSTGAPKGEYGTSIGRS
jgi:non-ribosomal peptide synthetase component F